MEKPVNVAKRTGGFPDESSETCLSMLKRQSVIGQ